MENKLLLIYLVLFGMIGSVYADGTDVTSLVLKNADFSQGHDVSGPSTDGSSAVSDWTLTGTGVNWNGTKAGPWNNDDNLKGYLEAFINTGNSLAGLAASQTTGVIPAGTYTVSFYYNGTYYKSDSDKYATNADLTNVTFSAGGGSTSITNIDGSTAQSGSFSFTLSEAQAVTFLLSFGEGTNTSWFALDNITVTYSGDATNFDNIIDFTASVGTTQDDWPKVSGNASGSWTETKQGSEIYNGPGYAYWAALAPTSVNMFEQTISNLPAGQYALSAFAAASSWTNSDNDDSNENKEGAYLFAGDEKTQITTNKYGSYTVLVTLSEGGDLQIGVCAESNNGNNWAYLAEVQLYKLDGLTISDDSDYSPLECTGNVTIERSMTGNVWNTLVVPFDMTIPSEWTVKEVSSFSEGTLSFTNASSIEAGKPYIVKPSSDVTSFSATGVTLKKDLVNTTVGKGTTVTMTGTYKAGTVPTDSYIIGIKNDESILYKVNSTVSIKPFRAYFTVSGATPGARIALNFDDDEVTGITLQEIENESGNAGIKDGKYLENGKIVIVKNGVKYATNGQIMK